jgi:hypothetical protein
MVAQSVLDELTEDGLTRDHVEHRVADWADRFEALYAGIEQWLAGGWVARRGDPVEMHEELMRTFGIPPRPLPTLDLLRDGDAPVGLRPYGLWIIGANGRIDLVKGSQRYILVDRARTFEAPDWRVSPAQSRSQSRHFNQDWLRVLLQA